MKKIYSIHLLLIFIFCCVGNDWANAQQSLLVNLGSNICANPDSPAFSIISDPFGTPSVLSNCDLHDQLVDYNNTFIAYNPKDNKIYINDVRYVTGSKIWVMDMGLPNNIACPVVIPVSPDFAPAYSTNNFEFDNSGNLWSVRFYSKSTGICSLDQYDILSGNILASKILQFPMDNLPTDIGNGDLCILPNGRLFATFGRDSSRLYEITNYNDGIGDAVATYLQTLPENCFGIAYLNGILEVTGTNSIDSCYYFDYNITTNTLGLKKSFQNGKSPIDNASISPVVGATKRLLGATKINNNTAELTYEIYIQNLGNAILNNINVTEDLGTVFGAGNISNVSTEFIPGYNTPGLTLNSSYNGTTITTLLNSNQTLVNQTSSNPDYFFKLQIKCTVTNLQTGIIYYNSAIANATIGSGVNQVNITDSSNNGPSAVVDPNKNGIANEFGENIPTPFNFTTIPVKFIYSSAYNKENIVIIDWKIATPIINGNKFIIEYSKDGIQWQKAGEIMITDFNQGNYQFQELYFAENKFYRIKETDKDGMAIYSTTMKLTVSGSKQFEAYPNPVKNSLLVYFPKTDLQFNEIELTDILGRRIYYTRSNNQSVIINTTHFSNGTYLLRVKDNNSVNTQKIFIKH